MTAPLETPRDPDARPRAVIAHALLALAGGLLLLPLALYFGATSAAMEDLVPGGALVGRFMALALVAASAAVIATAVGLLALRPWARVAILVIAGTLVAFCAASALVVIALPMQELFGADGARAREVRALMLAVYAIPAALGTWWLVYFTRPPTVARFARPEGIAPARIPLPIALVAWSTILGGALCLAAPLAAAPVPVPGRLLSGWSAGAIYLGIGVAQLVIGRGLLRLDERARRAGVAFFALATVYAVVATLGAGSPASASLDWALGDGIGGALPLDLSAIWWWMSGLVVAGFAVPAWLLVRWRHAFVAGASPPER